MTDQQPVTEGAVADERAATGERESLTQYGTRIALRASWIAGIVSALLVLILNAGRNPIPMLDDARSFGAIGLYFIVPAAFFVTAIAFVMGVNAWNERVAAERQRGWKIAIVPTAIAYTVLTGIVAIVMLQLAEPAFPFLALDRFQAAFVVGLVSAALIFWLTTQAIQITSGHLLHIAIIVAAAGVYLAASLSDDPLWWTVSFSSMGTHGTFTSWIFNTSLVFAGLMILVWLPYFMNDLRVLERHGLTDANKVKWMRNGLIALGIAVGLVGVFENGVSQLTDNIHNISAPMMGVFVIILALALRRLLPNFPRGLRHLNLTGCGADRGRYICHDRLLQHRGHHPLWRGHRLHLAHAAGCHSRASGR